MEKDNRSPLEENEDNSLETQEVTVEQSGGSSSNSSGQEAAPDPSTLKPADDPGSKPPEPPKRHEHLAEHLRNMNIYLLVFIFLLLVSGTVVFFVVYKSPKNTISDKNTPQALSETQLEQLAGSSQTIGNSSQVLNIGANTIFNGQVLIQKDLNVAGNIKIGGSLDLPGITVAGGAKFAQIQTDKLEVSGTTTLSGQLVSSSGINIAGPSSFSGQVTVGNLEVQNLQLSGTLNVNHIQTSGSRPTRTTGSAVGSGGTSSVSGTDTSGMVNINTGSGPSAGCFITVYFAKSYSTTPNIVITPVGSAAGGLQYYINRSNSNFSICTASTPGTGKSFGFDYIVLD